MNPQTPNDTNAKPFFSIIPAYVLYFTNSDGISYVHSEQTKLGNIITCFLTPFEAMVEAAHFSRLGRPYQVMAASDVGRHMFRDIDGNGLIAGIHLGWPARSGRLLLRPSGRLAGYSRLMHHWAHEPLMFEVDHVALSEYVKLRELAGFYAWQEASKEFLNWHPERRCTVIEYALDSIGSIDRPGKGASDCEKIALFDPEFGQWHFVPPTADSMTNT